jgi:hypothetical protein
MWLFREFAHRKLWVSENGACWRFVSSRLQAKEASGSELPLLAKEVVKKKMDQPLPLLVLAVGPSGAHRIARSLGV